MTEWFGSGVLGHSKGLSYQHSVYFALCNTVNVALSHHIHVKECITCYGSQYFVFIYCNSIAFMLLLKSVEKHSTKNFIVFCKLGTHDSKT